MEYELDVESSPEKWLVGGTSISFSNDGGSKWYDAGAPSNRVASVNSIANNGDMWLAATTSTGANNGEIYYSVDGFTWTATYQQGVGIATMKHNGHTFVAVDLSGGVLYSHNGLNWQSGSITYASSAPTIIGDLAWNGLFWLVGTNGDDGNGNRVWKSYDGVSWQPLATITTSVVSVVEWTGTEWFISGNADSSISEDGVSWSLLANRAVKSLAHNGSIYVASIDSSSSLLWSYDLANWTTSSAGTNVVARVKWTGSRFLALGTRISTSRDGIRWTDAGAIQSSCAESDSHSQHKILFNENLVLCGNAFSKNGGVSWTTLSSSSRVSGFNGRQYLFLDGSASSVSTNLRGGSGTPTYVGDLSANVVASSGSLWLAGGSNGLLRSADGFQWTAVLLPGSMVSCNGIAWNGSAWMISGTTSSSGRVIAYASENADDWTVASSTLGGGPVEWNGVNWMCGGETLAVSSNGKTWTSRPTDASFGPITGIAWSGKSWVLSTAPLDPASTAGLLYSSDGGATWTATSLLGNSYRTVGWSGTTFVAITSTGSLLYSYNGLNWTNSGATTNGRNVAWTNPDDASVRINMPTIIGGSGATNTMIYSSQGGAIFRGLGNSTFSTSCRSIAWNGSIWVAGGEGDTNTLAYSYDGKRWTGLGKTIFSSRCYSVSTNGTTWLAMGAGTANTMAVSLDGKHWTGLGTTIFDLSGISSEWNGEKWLAVGSGSTNTLAYSTDIFARSWTGLGSTVFSSPRCVKWIGVGGLWLVGGDASGSSTIASSSGALSSWTYASGGGAPATRCSAISWNGREVVAVGDLVATSADGLSWTTSSSTDANDVEWNGREWVLATVPAVVCVPGTMTEFVVANSASLMTEAHCVGTSSGIGAFVPNNRLYINAGERLSVYGPGSYDASVSQPTSLSFNLDLPV
jgi:hypothetical protein